MKLKKEIIESSEFEKLIKGTNYKEILLEMINDTYYRRFFLVNEFQKEIWESLPKMVKDGAIDERYVE